MCENFWTMPPFETMLTKLPQLCEHMTNSWRTEYLLPKTVF